MTPEHETAQEVAEFLGLVYAPGMGAFDPDGRAVYMDDDSFLMSEEQEQETREWREQHRVAPSALTIASIRNGSKLMWRDVGTNIMQFAFFGNRDVMDMHIRLDRSMRLWEWKEARAELGRVWRS